tara:strand:- start:893 stop:3223 length:2331 start_codon:yes stop_codon:yes gene_type:complete
MPYSDKDYKVSNVNYLNKDFSSFKSTLMEYAKTYFPNTYRDFNETSPGMMLIEMSAYVGDVLSFYIDQQYKEMMLPLAEERRNVINMSNMLGYKVSPINPAYVDLTFTQIVTADDTDLNNIRPNFSQTFAIDKGAKISSITDSTIIFETLDVVDFTTSGSGVSYETPEKNTFNSNGVVQDFKLTRKVRAISGETKTKTFSIGTPQKFLKLTLPETNVVDIISVVDQSSNKYYQVDFLAQDQVKVETHYDNDDTRTNAYSFFDSNPAVSEVPVPYSLQYIKTSKRFTTEINEDNTTSIVFGNGVLRSGQIQESAFIQLDQVGITIPGEDSEIDAFVDPLDFGNNSNTLGETPAHTVLTVTYRVGGGISSNVVSGDLTTIDSKTRIVGPATQEGTLTVTNDQPARGGSEGLSIEEIRRGAKAFFATQNRCVTQEDYEARVLSMPAKFGNIAKVFVEREDLFELNNLEDTLKQNLENKLVELETKISELNQEITNLTTNKDDIKNDISSITDTLGNATEVDGNYQLTGEDFLNIRDTLITNINSEIADVETNITNIQDDSDSIATIDTDLDGIVTTVPSDNDFGTINLYVLSYDNNKNLVTLPQSGDTIHPVKTNLINYLSQFRIVTDEIIIRDGKIVNFGVVFDVVAHKSENKSDVKLRCINTIINYFNIDKLQFRQPLYTGDLEYELMGLDGVRSVNFVRLTQGDEPDFTELFPTKLYYFDKDDSIIGTDVQYGYQYPFGEFYGDSSTASDGVVLPSVTPSVFELKNPKDNVKGIIR